MGGGGGGGGGFSNAINTYRRYFVTTGVTICVAESISLWYGLGGIWCQIGLAHYVKLVCKLESTCKLEIPCCGQSGIMLTIKLKTLAGETQSRDFKSNSQHGTAALLQLLLKRISLGRNVCADFCFGSVVTT